MPVIPVISLGERGTRWVRIVAYRLALADHIHGCAVLQKVRHHPRRV